MLDLGVIESRNAEWSFPVVVVPKTGGHFRSCVDSCLLNERTVSDVYPIPRMDDCLDSLGDAAVVAYLFNIRILGPVAPLTGQYSRGGLN